MYTRVTLIKNDPGRVEEAIGDFRARVVPGAEKAPGFVGATLQVDREKGIGAAATMWESLEAMNAAERLAQRLREESVAATGGEVLDVDRFEVVVLDRAGDAEPPVFARVTQMHARPDRLDDLVAYLRDTVVPEVRGLDGYRALVAGVNRMTGRVFVSAGYATAADRAATEGGTSPLRSRAAEIGGTDDIRVDAREIVVITMKAPAAT